MLEIAQTLAKRGTCLKRKVGCVITDFNGNILSTGYNGQPKGHLHCDEYSPCPAFVDTALSCSAIHAEVNALVKCPDITKAHAIYITEKPCEKCMMLIENTKIAKIVIAGVPEDGVTQLS
jgi:dCMP deaminase